MRDLRWLLLTLLAIGHPVGADDAAITDPTHLATLRAAIVAADYRCPAVGMAKHKRPSAEGDRIKVWCGYGPDQNDPNLVYMVTLRPSGRADVAPSGMFSQ